MQALQAQQQRALLLEDNASISKGSNSYASPYQFDGVGLTRENDAIGFGNTSLTSRGKPRRHEKVRQEEFMGEA